MAIKNVLLNSDFEHPTNPTYNWQLEAPYVTLQNTGGVSNSKCIKFAPHPTGAPHVLSQSMDLVPGASYQFKCQANFSGSHMSLYLTMKCDRPGGQTSVQNSGIFTAGSGWREISHNFTVPSDVSSENVWLHIYAINTSGAPSSSYALVDNVELVGEDGVGSGAVNTYRRTVDWALIRTQPNGLYYYTIWPNALVKIAEKLTFYADTWYRVTRLHDAGGWCKASEIGLPNETPVGTLLSAVCNTFAVRIWNEENQSTTPFRSPPTGRMPVTILDYGHSTMYKTFYGFEPLAIPKPN